MFSWIEGTKKKQVLYAPSPRTNATELRRHVVVWLYVACILGTQMRTTLSPGDAEAAVALECLGE